MAMESCAILLRLPRGLPGGGFTLVIPSAFASQPLCVIPISKYGRRAECVILYIFRKMHAAKGVAEWHSKSKHSKRQGHEEKM
jgi:hypothetical protein